MQQDQIYEQLSSVFHQVFGDDDIVLTPTTSAADLDDWDSLSHIRLMISVEKKFGVKFSASEIGKLKNVGALVELIQVKV